MISSEDISTVEMKNTISRVISGSYSGSTLIILGQDEPQVYDLFIHLVSCIDGTKRHITHVRFKIQVTSYIKLGLVGYNMASHLIIYFIMLEVHKLVCFLSTR